MNIRERGLVLECKALEVCAVWELEHLVDMLNGSTKLDESIRKPVK